MKKLLSFATLILISVLGKAQTYNVTFQLDMSMQSGFITPEVNGTFNNWCGNCFQMTDNNGDDIWEATTQLAAGTYEYKFAADNWSMQENLVPGSTCTVTNSGFTNRSLVVTGNTTLPVVCWGSCVDCAQTPNFYNVTFQLDMNGQTGFTTPEVNGTFNAWCGNCTQMTDANGDNIWEVTVYLQEGNYEYKFSYDNWAGQETLVPGSSCTITNGEFTNRTLNANATTTLPAVCWGSCTPCGQSSGPYNITFQLDMSQASFPFTTPEVNGTFNNWCGNCAPMSDADRDQICTLTIPLPVGNHTYKFSYDNWAGQEELTVGSSCTFTENGFTNRLLDVTQNDSLTAVCWASCEACATEITSLHATSWNVFPNPSHGAFNVTIPSDLIGSNISIFNNVGQNVHQSKIVKAGVQNVDISAMAAGQYFIVISNENASEGKLIIIE